MPITKTEKFEIIYQDQDLLIINKPNNLLVHQTTFNERSTLEKYLMEYDPSLKNIPRAGIVHRLDKQTTGVMLIAKNMMMFDSLKQQWQDHDITKIYLGICHGHWEKKQYLIKLPLTRQNGTTKQLVKQTKEAKLAITKIIDTVNLANDMSLVKCQIITGIRHQIRAHLAYLHHNIFNDPLYGLEKDCDGSGQYLHAYQISFFHHGKKQLMSFTCSPDQKFLALLNKLGGKIDV